MEAFQPQTICDLLRRGALNYPKHGLTFLDTGIEDFIAYGDLLQQAHANGNKLRDAGIVKNGKIVAVYFDNHKSNVIWTWSVIAAGGVPAILPPFSLDCKTRDGQLQNLRTLFGRPRVLTSLSLLEQLAGLSDASVHAIETVDPPIRKSTAIDGDFGHGAHSSDSLATLLFTSGSTGHSKAVEFTHRQLITSVRAKQQTHSLDSTTSFMSWISFDHSANFCELHLNAMNTGANQYLVPASNLVHQPRKFFELLGKYQIGYTFSPNSFLAAASKAWEQQGLQEKKCDFSKLKVVMVGGEANKVANLHQANSILRAGGACANVVKAAYGLSETCSACFYNLQTPSWDLRKGNVFATVGKHLTIGLQLRLVDDELDPVSDGEDGKIQLRGDIVFPRYHNNAAATESCMTLDGWFDTGDLGRLDSGGNLAIVGRSKEILILGGNNYSSFELEHAIESRSIPGVSVSWTATFSVWDEDRDTEGVVVLFSPTDEVVNDEDQLRATIGSIKEAVLMFCSATPLDVIPLPKEEMPKSTIGKLSRQKLKKFYLDGQFDKYRVDLATPGSNSGTPGVLQTEMQHTVGKLLAEQLDIPIDQIGAGRELAQFGMNSIDYLRLKRALEVAMDGADDPIPMPSILEARTVADLATLVENRSNAQYQPLVTLRANGSRPPLFLFPPGGGEFMIWLPLLEYLPDRPVYALRVKGLERASEGTFEGLEDMLDAYETALLTAHPTGPYALLGLCFGGTIAFEIGKRLERKGHTLAFCGGLDNPPHLQDVLHLGGPRDNLKSFLLDLLAYHKLVPLSSVPSLEKRYASLSESATIQTIIDDFSSQGLLSSGLTAEKISAWHRVHTITYAICQRYRPEGIVRIFDVVWASPFERWSIDLRGWQKMVQTWEPFAREGVGYRWVPGHHFALFDEENVPHLAKALNELMAGRERTLKNKTAAVMGEDGARLVAASTGMRQLVARDSAVSLID